MTAGTAPGTDPWQAAEQWAAGVPWAIDQRPPPRATVPFASGYGDQAWLTVTPGRVTITGHLPGMSPDEARRLNSLICLAVAMAEHPQPAGPGTYPTAPGSPDLGDDPDGDNS